MSHYIHHVPGRLRIRAKALRRQSAKTQAVITQLQNLAGVRELCVNPHAGSITIRYDHTQLTHVDVLAVLERADCLRMPMATEDQQLAGQMGEMFGKALFTTVMQKTVERSVQSLVGAFL